MREDLYTNILNQEKRHWWHIAKRRLVRILVDKYVSSDNANILDVGCGTGMIMKMLQNHGNVFGVDSSRKAIDICKNKGLQKVKIGYAEKLPYINNSFDSLIVLDVLEHSDEIKSLKEFIRVLKNNGTLILTVPAYQWMWSEWDRILGHKKRYTKRLLVNLLEKNNFRIIKASYMYSYLLLPVFFIRKIKQKFISTGYASDFLINFNFINKIMSHIANLEISLLTRINIPFGLTLIVVARK